MGRKTCGRKRKGHPIGVESLPALSKNRPTKTQRLKKARSTRAEHEQSDKTATRVCSSVTRALIAPLSTLMNGPDLIPVRNVALWVGRSAEMRRMEAELENGRIKRPLNAFMLYRFAYINRARVWCSDNHQNNLSIVIGKSWSLEPDKVCNAYKEYARIEKANHRIAHPEYKFRPRRLTTALLHSSSSRSSSNFNTDEALLLEGHRSTPTSNSSTSARPWEGHTSSPALDCGLSVPAELYWRLAPVDRRVCTSRWLASHGEWPLFWPSVNGVVGAGCLQCEAQSYVRSSETICMHQFAAGALEKTLQSPAVL